MPDPRSPQRTKNPSLLRLIHHRNSGVTFLGKFAVPLHLPPERERRMKDISESGLAFIHALPEWPRLLQVQLVRLGKTSACELVLNVLHCGVERLRLASEDRAQVRLD